MSILKSQLSHPALCQGEPVHLKFFNKFSKRYNVSPDVMCCLYFSAATGTPAPLLQATGSTPQSTRSSLVVHADVHRANAVEEDEDYDEVLEMEQGNDGEDLEAVAAEGRFQLIHSLIYMCTCTELVVKIDSKETHLLSLVFIPVGVVEVAVLLL